MFNIFDANPYCTLKQLKEELRNDGINVSLSTLSRSIKRMDYIKNIERSEKIHREKHFY